MNRICAFCGHKKISHLFMKGKCLHRGIFRRRKMCWKVTGCEKFQKAA